VTPRLYFGTDGVRGPYGGPVVNEQFFQRIGAAAARWLQDRGVAAGKVVIGRDTRASGASLCAAIGEGIARGGGRPVTLGIVPTPAVSQSVIASGAALGVSITASHNPASDNGVKFFGPDGAKLTDADEAEIEGLMDRAPAGKPPARGEGASLPVESILESYMASAQRILPAGSLEGWRIALDTANGATCISSPGVFRALGAELACLGDQPNGRNINDGVGSEHPEALGALVRSSGSRLGIAHDGDGDRCVLCDETGSTLDGDELMAILATHALAKGTLARRMLVVTLQSNLGLDAAVAAAGGSTARTAIGDRYVAERMRAEGATLGGESSGHILSFEFSPTGDGLVAALKVVAIMHATGKPLSELRKAMRRYPQRSSALRVRHKKLLSSLPTLTRVMQELEAELGTSGRILVRYSGTEPKLRLLVEGATDGVVRFGIARLEAAARADLEVL
jgi:phosphoglucosamine mutase